MMTIEDEIKHLIAFLSHPAGFDVDMAGQLCIRPIYETTSHWEVDWEVDEDDENGIRMTLQFHKVFDSLEDAATFFVEKRHYLCLGLDFNQIAAEHYNKTGQKLE
jgi:hypothetical protein